MKPLSRSAIACILVFAFVLSAALKPVSACGPFSRYAIFSYTKHPDLPLAKYSRGDIGVLQPSYSRAYLYVAYRMISVGSFAKQEQDALSGLWDERRGSRNENENGDARSVWYAARAKVSGIGADPQVRVDRERQKGEYDYFLNCHTDAFKTAARILEERIAKFDATSTEVKEWTLAQDQVFSNCGGGQTIPEQTSSSDPIIKADRAYQIAAAHFYAMNFDDARTHFERIASDNTSPWHQHAQYLVARSLIRKASLGDAANRLDSLTQAETVLKKFLAGNKTDPLHQSARGLLDLVELRLRPEARIRQLALTLVSKTPNENLKQDLVDYTRLVDRYTGDSDSVLDENLKKAVDASEKDDLTEWLLAFQSEEDGALARSIENWDKTHSRPWLIASLAKVDAMNAKATTLMADAERIEAGSPAYATAQYHLVRLLIEKGDRAGAIRKLDALLQGEAELPPSAANQFRHQRMILAKDLNDFLKYALRTPAAFSWDEDGLETPIDINDDSELKLLAGRALLDADSTKLLNERFPLALLRDAAASNVLPDHVRKQVALAAWTRSVILDDVESGKAIAPLAASLAPELKAYLNAYLTASTREARQSAGLYAILKIPGLRPFFDSNIGRLTPIDERDTYRDNWWCDITPAVLTSEEIAQAEKLRAKPPVPAALEFLSNAQAAVAKREHAQLMSLGSAPNYLARETIEWAKRTPNDPRVPEALHLAVMSTRYGCTDKDSPKWSKAAFDVLHKRYPKSEWARKTPYWFKDV